MYKHYCMSSIHRLAAVNFLTNSITKQTSSQEPSLRCRACSNCLHGGGPGCTLIRGSVRHATFSTHLLPAVMACRSRATSSAVAGIERASHEVASSKPQLVELNEIALSSFSHVRVSRKLHISKVLELRQLAKLAAPIIITMMCHQSMIITDMVWYNSGGGSCGLCIQSGMRIV
jgi:hypothetical protein